MRYRPLGPHGTAVSAISLALRPDPRLRSSDWASLVYAAMESGVNTFEVIGADDALARGLGVALSAVERRLVFVGWRVEAESPQAIAASVRDALQATGLGRLDLVTFAAADADRLSRHAVDVLNRFKQSGEVRLLGVCGEGDGLDVLIAAGGFDVLATSFSLRSGWRERNRLRGAASRNMAVIGVRAYDPAFHEAAAAAVVAGRPGRRDHPLAVSGTYAFLDGTDGWTAEELCIAYALTEPTLSSVQVEAADVARLEALAQVADRELPQGVPAQIEMARFTPPPEPQRRRRA